jgi:hypothetical protein
MIICFALVFEFQVLHPIEKNMSINIFNISVVYEQTITGPILLHCSSDITMRIYSNIDKKC